MQPKSVEEILADGFAEAIEAISRDVDQTVAERIALLDARERFFEALTKRVEALETELAELKAEKRKGFWR